MFDQAVVRTGVKYGVSSAVAGFLIVLALFFLGYDPFGQTSLLSLLFVPVFIFLGLKDFKRYHESEIGFFRGFSVAMSISFYCAFSSAMIMYLFSVSAGYEVLQKHIAEMKQLMEASKDELVKLLGEKNYEAGYMELDKRTPFSIAYEDFFRKIFIGFVFSIIAGVFFRK